MIKPNNGSPENRVADVRLRVAVRLGQAAMPVRELLNLRAGSFIPAGKIVGAPLDIVIDDGPVAQGEIVLVNGRFAVRVVGLGSPVEQ